MKSAHATHSASKLSILFSAQAKAIMVGALVLGAGATVTLASWNDTEVTDGQFAAGAFNLQSTADGLTWADHDVASATLAFDGVAKNLSPDTTVYAPFALRLADGTTNQAKVTVSAVGTGDTAFTQKLSYTVVSTSGAWGCDAAAVAKGTPILSGTIATNTSADAFTLTSPKSAVNLCVAVTAASDLPQAKAGSMTWTFSGQSTDAAAL